MRIQPTIDVTVAVHYLEIEGLRFAPGGVDKEAEWERIRASAKVPYKGGLHHIFITGKGRYVKQNGEVGQRDATMRFASLRNFPTDWQERIMNDLQAMADKVIIGHDPEEEL